MLRLRVWKYNETAQYDIELYENAPVNLKYQFTDITQVNKSVGSYSQTFRVPMTQRNQNFFGGIAHPDVQPDANGYINSTWNTKQKIRAELSYDTVPLMNGHIQVKGIYRQKKHFYDLELVFFGESVDLASSIGQQMLSDLDLSQLDITVNFTNILSMMFETGSTPFDGTMIPGVVDRGQNWSYPWDGINRQRSLYQNQLTPMVQAKYLLNKILSTAGFSYNSTFIDSTDFGNIYMPMFSGSNLVISDDDTDARLMAAIGTSTFADQTTTSTTPTLMQMHVTGADFGLDAGSNFTESTTYKWTAPYSTFIAFAISARITNADLRLRKTSTSGATEDIFVITNTNTINHQTFTFSSLDLNNEFNGLIYVAAGDIIQLYMNVPSTSSGTATLEGSDSALGPVGYLHIMQGGVAEAGFDYDMQQNVPVIKQIEFLSSLQAMFNLVIVPDKNNPKILNIEPFQDYIASGTDKDWTDKIDYTKDVVIKPTTDIQKSKYMYSHAEGQDFVNKAIKDQMDRVYGTKKIEDEQNDYAKGEQTIKTFTAPYTVSTVPNNGFPCIRMINENGEVIKKPKARFCYYNGLVNPFVSSDNQITLVNDSGTGVAFSFFPVFTNVSDVFSEPQDNDLNFGVETPLIPHATHPINTLYLKYYAGYTAELFSDNARTLECFMYLDTYDIESFEFNDRIQIENTQYRVLEISGFDATQKSTCKVKLIKILQNIPDCVDTPTGYDSSAGVVTFNNSATDYGSKTCCERYGFVWTPDKAGGNGRCRPLGELSAPPTIPGTEG